MTDTRTQLEKDADFYAWVKKDSAGVPKYCECGYPVGEDDPQVMGRKSDQCYFCVKPRFVESKPGETGYIASERVNVGNRGRTKSVLRRL